MLLGLSSDPQQPTILLNALTQNICKAFPDSKQDVRRGKCVLLTSRGLYT